MKNIALTTSLLIVLITTSCHKDESFQATRRIINETSYLIKIDVFGDDIRFQYEINPQDTLDIQGKCSCCVPRICNLGWHSSLAYGEITYDDVKIQRSEDLSCNEKAINSDPHGGTGCNGYTSTEENGVIIYTYRITQEDYDNAEFIDRE